MNDPISRTELLLWVDLKISQLQGLIIPVKNEGLSRQLIEQSNYPVETAIAIWEQVHDMITSMPSSR